MIQYNQRRAYESMREGRMYDMIVIIKLNSFLLLSYKLDIYR